jgi:hypothetical protein
MKFFLTLMAVAGFALSGFAQDQDQTGLDQYRTDRLQYLKRNERYHEALKKTNPKLAAKEKRLAELEQEKIKILREFQEKILSEEETIQRLRALVSEEIDIKQSKEYLVEQEIRQSLNRTPQ